MLLLLSSQRLQGQSAPTLEGPSSPRKSALMPWQLVGLDGEFPLRHRQLLLQLRELVKTTWLAQPVNLDQETRGQEKPFSLNQQQLSRRIDVGRPLAQLNRPHYLQPIICPVGEHLVLALELIASETQHVLAIAQILVPRDAWENFAAHAQPPPSPAAAWQNALKELQVKAVQNSSDVRNNPFKLRLGLLRGSQDSRIGSHLCLNLLLTQAMLPHFTLLSSIGDLEATHLRLAWNIQPPILRGTRELVLDWGMHADGPQFAAEGRWSEAVRGSSIDRHILLKTSMDLGRMQLQVPASFIQMLQDEEDTLKIDELPQVSHIYGAWVYLDRGRAWGLDVNDRLYLDDGQRQIKGHVVGFFGTGAGLKTPKGVAIHEGAIVYIRKGQKKVKIGDRLNFDWTQYPTPWPPVAQPARASKP